MRQIAIFAIVDPREWEPKYVGMSYRPYETFKKRLSAPHRESAPRFSAWVDSMLSDGVTPRLVILREVYDLDGPEVLRETTERFRKSLYAVPPNFNRPLFRSR